MSGELLLLARTLFSLAAVLALAVLVLRFVVPRLSGAGARRKGGRLDVIETRALDRQNRLALVSVEGERFLLAYGQSGVRSLGCWPDDEAVEEEEPALGPVGIDALSLDALPLGSGPIRDREGRKAAG